MNQSIHQTSKKPTICLVDYFSLAGSIERLLEIARGDFDYLFIISMRSPWDASTVQYLEQHGMPVLMLDAVVADPSLVAHCAGITSIGDITLRETSRIAEAAGIAHYHSPEVADRISSKSQQRRAFAEHGVRQPQWCEVDLSSPSWKSTIPASLAAVPFIAKPVRGSGSAGVTFIPSLDEATELLAGAEGLWVFEEEIVGVPNPSGEWLGDHLSVQTITFNGEHQLIGVMDKPPHAPPYRATGDVVPSVLPEELRKECERVALAAVDALGIRYGWSHTELKLAANGPNVLEVNGRMSLTADDACARMYHSSPLCSWFDVALGVRPKVKEFEYGGKIICQYIVQAPGKPVDPDAVRRIISELESQPEVFKVHQLSLDHLRGNSKPITINSVMTVWMEAVDADDLRLALGKVNGLLRTVGLCEWTDPNVSKASSQTGRG
jgi:hypothetical protein